MGALGVTLGVWCAYERTKWGQKAKILKNCWFFKPLFLFSYLKLVYLIIFKLVYLIIFISYYLTGGLFRFTLQEAYFGCLWVAKTDENVFFLWLYITYPELTLRRWGLSGFKNGFSEAKFVKIIWENILKDRTI